MTRAELVKKLAGLDININLTVRELLRFAEAKRLQDSEVNALCGRLAAGEPLAYILGEWDFYGLTLEVTPDVLIPRPETERLVDVCLGELKHYGGGAALLDLCCGSGCIGLAVKHELPDCAVTLADISPEALCVAKRNAMRVGDVSIIETDALTEPPFQDGCFDIIVCNPPYIARGEEISSSVRDYEPNIALFTEQDGLEFYKVIPKLWKRTLRERGTLVFEVGYKQADGVINELQLAGYCDIGETLDYQGIRRIIHGRK